MKVQGDIDEKRMGMVEGSSFSGRDLNIYGQDDKG